MNELAKRCHKCIGSGMGPTYSCIADGSAVTAMLYTAMEITDSGTVRGVLDHIRPDAVIHGAAWTAMDLAEDDDNTEKVSAVNPSGTANTVPGAKVPIHGHTIGIICDYQACLGELMNFYKTNRIA